MAVDVVDEDGSSVRGRVGELARRILLFPVNLTFLGTRGEIEARTRRHRMHTSLLVSHRGARVMIDCGLDWLGKLKRLDPNAIVLTHAHPDHAWGLKRGAPCPVYGTESTWQELQLYPIKDRHLIEERTRTKICGITFEAFPVEHSILSPAVGYRVSAGHARIFHAPDLIFIHDRGESVERRGNLHWRWRHYNAHIHSQARQSVNRSLAGPDTTHVVPKRGRSPRHYHSLRL